MAKQPKRPRDPNQLAKLMIDITSGDVEEGAATATEQRASVAGKLNDCVFEHKGQLPIFGFAPGLSENMCKTGMKRGEIKPFTDANGNAEPRRVIMKISVEHADVPVALPKDQ